jgi:hypothetical protein
MSEYVRDKPMGAVDQVADLESWRLNIRDKGKRPLF